MDLAGLFQMMKPMAKLLTIVADGQVIKHL